MESFMRVFHGSGMLVEKPEVLISGYYKSFGYGFYCTNIEKQAKRWALTKRPGHVVNLYNYKENSNLNMLKFDSMTDEWLEFVVNCRRGISHGYDIVEGPMADDTIWAYIDGIITKEAFWVLIKFKYPTHQIVFCNDKSLECLEYVGNYSV